MMFKRVGGAISSRCECSIQGISCEVINVDPMNREKVKVNYG